MMAPAAQHQFTLNTNKNKYQAGTNIKNKISAAIEFNR